MITRERLEDRVEAVLGVIQEVTGSDVLPDAYRERLSKLSFDELGRFALELVTNRSVEESMRRVGARPSVAN